jgi:hypothetical protein
MQLVLQFCIYKTVPARAASPAPASGKQKTTRKKPAKNTRRKNQKTGQKQGFHKAITQKAMQFFTSA